MGKTLIIIGFMGTGKTTVGHALAQKMALPQLDLDHYIVEKEKREISDIFAEKGEGYFRDIETARLKEVLTNGIPQVITTGGGVVIREENRNLMKQHGLCVALTAQADTIIQRVTNDPDRPLLQGGVEERVKTLLQQRDGMYDFAPIQLVTDGKNVEEIIHDLWQQPIFQQFLVTCMEGKQTGDNVNN